MGTLRSRGQNEQKWRETNEREDQPNTRQLCSKNRMELELRNSTADIRLRRPPPPLLSLPLFSGSYVIPDPCWPPAFPKQLGQIQTPPNAHMPIHTHKHTLYTRCFHRLRAWEHFMGSAQLVPGTKQEGDSPPCALSGPMFLCGCTVNVWVIWHWEYSFSFHCHKLGLDTQLHTVKK